MLRFICSECENEHPSGRLSNHSLRMAGTTSKLRAIARLDEEDLLCKTCADWIDEPGDSKTGWTTLDWHLSGLRLGKLERDYLGL